ncbi:hypothetical protein HPB50_020928 [Hyalomma asiaticum]|uniref:Uncharacterized protein n=1 Tax=Hyalomma asiaticum TaxID=266040 RepID=A0ACB7TQT2_HYAAI|nr:hypothetical protein HPB50_020928 [Hyalomma asiaticum]
MVVRSNARQYCVVLSLLLASTTFALAQDEDRYVGYATAISSTTTVNTTTTETTTTPKPDRLKEAYEAIKEKITRLLARELFPIVSELIYDPRLSTGCIGSLMKIGPALGRFDIWAVQMVDAIGRPHAGTMQGRIAAYGAYDQCLAVRHNEGLFQGRYCMVHLEHDGSEFSPSLRVIVNNFVEHYGLQYVGNLSRQVESGSRLGVPLYKTGLCVPSLCQKEDLQIIINHCHLSMIVTSFSLRKGFKKLMDMPNWGDYSNDLGFVHGMRVFSATWVVLGHSHMIRDVHASSDGIGFLKRIREDFPFTVQLNSFMAVETFLVITLMLPMAAVMGFIYILPAMVDGPMMREHRRSFEEPCDKNWWKMFTMSQNYVEHFNELCVPHFWYVAVDYQLAIISTIILAAIMPKWPKVSMWIMGAIVVASSLGTLIQTYVIDALPFGLIVTIDLK